MDILITLLWKLVPLCVIIILGFIAGRFLKVEKETVSSLLIYIIYPVVVFTGVVNVDLSPAALTLPLIVLVVACLICLLFYWLSGFFWNGTTRNLLAFSAGNANTGYFGLPVALAVLGDDHIGTYILCMLGITLYENSLGFFVTARARHGIRDSLLRLARLPTLYAFILGIIFNVFDFSTSSMLIDLVASFRAAMTLLGMMVIGLGLAAILKIKFDFAFVGWSFLAKFAAWPLLMATFIFWDNHLLHWYSADVHKVLMLIAFMPMGVNTVVFATELQTHPEKASFAVVLSTFFALGYIPLTAALFLV